MSVDLEDHFCDLPFSTWKNFESRVVSNTKTLLDLFEKYNSTATFLTFLGKYSVHILQTDSGSDNPSAPGPVTNCL